MSYMSEKEFITNIEVLFNNAKYAKFDNSRLFMSVDTDIIVSPPDFREIIINSANQQSRDPCKNVLSLIGRFILSSNSLNVTEKRKEYLHSWVDSVADIYLYNEKYKDSNMFNAIMLNGFVPSDNNTLNNEFINYIYENYLSKHKEVIINSHHEVYSKKDNIFLVKAFMKYAPLVVKNKDVPDKVKFFWNKDMMDFKEKIILDLSYTPDPEFSFSNIPEYIIDERIDTKLLMYLRTNRSNQTPFNESLNILLNKKASPEQIMEVYLSRVFYDAPGAKIREAYDKETLSLSDENICLDFLKIILDATAFNSVENDYLKEQLKTEKVSLFLSKEKVIEYFAERIRIAQKEVLWNDVQNGVTKKTIRI